MMVKGEGITVIIPAFNEERRIAATLKGVERIRGIDEVIVVDDGSTDGTAAAARSCGARVIRQDTNRGKGSAMQAGLAQSRGSIILFLDGDLGTTAAEAEKLLKAVLRGDADMAVARWPRRKGGGGFGLAQGLACWGIQRLTGCTFLSPLSGQRAVRRQYLDKLEGRFGVEVGMTVDCLRQGGRVLEVPVFMKHRPTGRDWKGFCHRGGQFCSVLWVLAKRVRGGIP